MREANGLLFIGDPHLTSRKPGKRRDEDFAGVVLGALNQAISIANELGLVPVFPGDIFDRPKETDESLKVRILRILKRANLTPISNVGNHDITHSALTDGDSLAYLAESGYPRVFSTSGEGEEFVMDGRRIAVGMTPYGQEIPRDATSFFPEAEGIVWITHHDVAFDGAYPGALEPHEIKGCRLVLNGHMHLTKPPVQAGQTLWMNPGNITPMSIDAANHVPCVWQFTPKGGLKRIELVYPKDIFDFTGYLVDPASKEELAAAAAAENDSAFVSILASELPTDVGKTDDGAMLLDQIMARFEAKKTDPAIQAIVLSLHRQAVEEIGRR
jgi:hypothetical protein